MTKVFLGSSSEALPYARQIEHLISHSEIPEMQCCTWDNVFPPGLLTFEAIEKIAREVAGSILLATPDDESVTRGNIVKVARTNVMIEFGYLTALLGRTNIALCKFDGVELATDLKGFTYISMGEYNTGPSVGPLDAIASTKIVNWLKSLSKTAEPISYAEVVHGYSGRWTVTNVFAKWRGIDLENDDYAHSVSHLDIVVPRNGAAGRGCIHGTLYVHINGCEAEFRITDSVDNVIVLGDGSIRFTSTTHSRQRHLLRGKPPQRDGFEPSLRGPYSFEWTLIPVANGVGTLQGDYINYAGNQIRSRGLATAIKS